MLARLIIDLSIREDDFNRKFITDIGTDNKEEKKLEIKKKREILFMVSTIRLTSVRL